MNLHILFRSLYPSSEVKYWVVHNFKGTSMEKFSKQLKAYGVKTYKEGFKVESRLKRINGGKPAQTWFGIKCITEYEADCYKNEII